MLAKGESGACNETGIGIINCAISQVCEHLIFITVFAFLVLFPVWFFIIII